MTDAECILLLADRRESVSFKPETLGERMHSRLRFDARNCSPWARSEKALFRALTP